MRHLLLALWIAAPATWASSIEDPNPTTIGSLPSCPGASNANLGKRHRVTDATSETTCGAGGGSAGAVATCTLSGYTCSDFRVEDRFDRIVDWTNSRVYNPSTGGIQTGANECEAMQLALNPYNESTAPGPNGFYRVLVRGTGSITFADTVQGRRWNGSSVQQDLPYNLCFGLIPTGDNATTTISGNYPVSDQSTHNHPTNGSIEIVFENASLTYDSDAAPVQVRPTVIFQLGDSWMAGADSAGALDSAGGYFTGTVAMRGTLNINFIDDAMDTIAEQRTMLAVDGTDFIENQATGAARMSSTIAFFDNGANRTTLSDFHLRVNDDSADDDNYCVLSFNTGQATEYNDFRCLNASQGIRLIGSSDPVITNPYVTGAEFGLLVGDGTPFVEYASDSICHAEVWTTDPDDVCGSLLQGHNGGQVIGGTIEGTTTALVGLSNTVNRFAMTGTNVESAGTPVFHYVTAGFGVCTGGTDPGEICWQTDCAGVGGDCSCGVAAGGISMVVGPETRFGQRETHAGEYGVFAIGECASDGNLYGGGGAITFQPRAKLSTGNYGGTTQAFAVSSTLTGQTPWLLMDSTNVEAAAQGGDYLIPTYARYVVTGTTRHATDCTAVTNAIRGTECFEEDANTIYVCEPSVDKDTLCAGAGDPYYCCTAPGTGTCGVGVCSAPADWTLASPAIDKVNLRAARCNNAEALTMYDHPTTNAPAVACFGTSPMRFGGLNFVDGAAARTSQTHLRLPSDWTGDVDVHIHWFSSSTSTNSVVWTLATVCRAAGEGLLSPTFNTAQTVADANNATASTLNAASISTVTMTGCAAGEELFLRIGRDPTNGSDTLAATTTLLGLEVTLRRKP